MAGGERLILTRSAPLRLLTLLLFYFTQGFPIGLFFYAVPSWMAAHGAGTGEIATVVATAGLPWSLKLVNGFLIDRYTFLPMGRRRSWIIGAQGTIVLGLLAGAVLSPAHTDVWLIAAVGFMVNLAVTFQDVGIDSLAVDIMPESERAKAAGVMFGAQVLGTSAATALGGVMLEAYGFYIGMMAVSLVPLAVMIYGIAIREREGERRLPWSPGESHPHNVAVQADSWGPLLKNGFFAVIAPLSLVLLPILLIRSLPAGAHEAFHPVMVAEYAGWKLSDYTNVMSVSGLVAGLLGLTIGGWAVDAVGAQRSLTIAMALGAVAMATMGLARDHWDDDLVLYSYIFGTDIIGLFISIATIPIAMRMCSPAVAATQFTMYMAVANFGRPLGASLAGATAGAGNATLMYFLLAGAYAVVVAALLFIRFPTENRQFHETAEALPQGEGLAPARD